MVQPGKIGPSGGLDLSSNLSNPMRFIDFRAVRENPLVGDDKNLGSDVGISATPCVFYSLKVLFIFLKNCFDGFLYLPLTPAGMIVQPDVNYLVSTYELPPSLAGRIGRIVEREHHQDPFSSFDVMYDRVAYLVDRLGRSREEGGIRLDYQPKGDGTLFKHGLFAHPLDFQRAETAEGCPSEPGLTVVEALSLLLSKLTPAQRTVIEYLVRESRRYEQERYSRSGEGVEDVYTSTSIFSPQLLEHSDELVARLEELVRTYTINGTVLIPRRPIVHVRWKPELWVRYGRRNFGGNPLQFFRDHVDVYGRFRTELALRQFDSGLASALRRAGQLHEAIPPLPSGGQMRELGQEEKQEIAALYQRHTSVRAVRANLSFRTYEPVISRCLKEQGIEPRKQYEKNPLSSAEQQRICGAFDRYGSASEAARHVPYDVRTVLKYARLHGRTILQSGKHVQRSLLSPKQLQRIGGAFASCKGSISQASRLLGHTRGTIKCRWEEQGFLGNGQPSDDSVL